MGLNKLSKVKKSDSKRILTTLSYLCFDFIITKIIEEHKKKIKMGHNLTVIHKNDMILKCIIEIVLFGKHLLYMIYGKVKRNMRQCMDSENLHRRLKKVSGQINAIDRMIDEDIPCEDILVQINAVKGAMHKIAQIILEGHINHCVKDGIEHGDAEKTIRDFTKAVEHFARMS